MGRQTVFGFQLDRTEEPLTAHGGLALLAEFNHGLGVCGLANRYLPGPGSHRGYTPSVFVDRLILMLQAGGQCLEDLHELTREAGLLRRLGQEVVPDPDTVGDWLRRRGDPQTGQAGLVGLGQGRDALTARLLRRDGHETYTLDADATLVVGEKRDARWSYKGVRGYMPMLGFLWETPVCLVDEFREGTVSPGAGQLEFYRQGRARMPVGKRLARYRADSASYQAALINELEADQVRWAITADQDVAVKAVIAGLPPGAWQEPEPGCGYQVAEAVHSMNQTKTACRLSIKREERVQDDLFEPATGPYAYHVVASHWPQEEKTATRCYHGTTSAAKPRTLTRNYKPDWGWSSCRVGIPGPMRVFFRIGVLAYNLFIGFKRLACPAAWSSQTIATVRWRLVQVAGARCCAMRGAWSCVSCWMPRRLPVGAPSASGAGR